MPWAKVEDLASAGAWDGTGQGSVGAIHICIWYIYIYYLYTIYIWRARKIFGFLSFAAGFGFIFGSWFYAFLFLLFSDSLLLCFSAFLLLCFSAFCFPCFSASLLFCFSAFLLLCFLLSLLLCFSCFSAFCFPCFSVLPASLLRTSTILLFLFFFSHVSLMLYFLLLCFCASCLSCLFVFHFLLLYSVLFVSKWNPRDTLGETQRNPKEILIRNPDKKPYMKP